MTKKEKIPLVNVEWCKGCTICVEFCPREALAIDEIAKAKLVYPEKCSACGICELLCPDLAIELK